MKAVADASVDALMEAARAARERAYAPYSGFKVGAAVRGAAGVVVTGANVENSSYGLSMCAERSAVFGAIAGGVEGLEAIAIVAEAGRPAYPCGACRQVLFEVAPDIEVFVEDGRGIAAYRLEDLLPHPFTLEGEAGGSTEPN